MNKVLLIGELFDKPVLTRTRTNVLMANFFLSTLHGHVDDNGLQTNSTQLHPCRCFQTLAEIVSRIPPLKTILVEGRIQSHGYPGTRGETVILAGEILLFEPPVEHPDDDDHQSAPKPALTPRSYCDEDV